MNTLPDGTLVTIARTYATHVFGIVGQAGTVVGYSPRLMLYDVAIDGYTEPLYLFRHELIVRAAEPEQEVEP